MKFTDEKGKVWEWRGQYHKPKIGESFLDESGGIWAARTPNNPERAIIYPVPVIHEFGGVKFEETGEVRKVQFGEWWLDGDECTAYFQGSRTKTGETHPILRPYCKENPCA